MIWMLFIEGGKQLNFYYGTNIHLWNNHLIRDLQENNMKEVY